MELSADQGPGGPLLQIEALCVEQPGPPSGPRLLDRVSLSVAAGQTVGLVGESGSGKTLTALSVLRLCPPGLQITSGQVLFQGRDLLTLAPAAMRRVRGRQIAMVFQEPQSALNPTLRVADQVAEVLRAHGKLSRKAARVRAVELLGEVGIGDAQRCGRAYPHQLSGGMRQRVLLAAALACDPELLLADEPTTALDVTLQAQILALIQQQQRRRGMGLLLVTHDLALAAQRCSELVVLLSGQVMEQGPTRACIEAPEHPYTALLLQAARRLSGAGTSRSGARGVSLGGGPGCRFAPRCPRVRERCWEETPQLERSGAGRARRCFYPLPPPREG